MHDAAFWFLVGTALIVFAYLVVRAASFAYFKTRLEYLRSVLRALREGKR